MEVFTVRFESANETEGGLDGVLLDDTTAALDLLVGRLLAVAGRTYVPASTRLGLTHFQLTRGLLGVSTESATAGLP